jgi:hypothetical protein
MGATARRLGRGIWDGGSPIRWGNIEAAWVAVLDGSGGVPRWRRRQGAFPLGR